uniref:Uncharacterized protein n=1 Tax=Oryza punctata TaxID=4537 RepID=A0A0E0M0P0_ORYPU
MGLPTFHVSGESSHRETGLCLDDVKYRNPLAQLGDELGKVLISPELEKEFVEENDFNFLLGCSGCVRCEDCESCSTSTRCCHQSSSGCLQPKEEISRSGEDYIDTVVYVTSLLSLETGARITPGIVTIFGNLLDCQHDNLGYGKDVIP